VIPAPGLPPWILPCIDKVSSGRGPQRQEESSPASLSGTVLKMLISVPNFAERETGAQRKQ
jgi:hypothetical protein